MCNLSLAGVALAAGCSSSPPVPEAGSACPTPVVSTAGWERIDLGPFSALLPRGFTAVDVQPIDSRAGEYHSASDSVRFAYDYGWYSSDLAPDPGRLIERTRCTDSIGNKPATVVIGELVHAAESGRHVVAGAWRNVENSDPPVHLTVMSTTHDSTQVDVLLAILDSVEFE